jgi:hypothetical protein
MHFSAHHPGLDRLPLESLPSLANLLVAHMIGTGCTPEETVRIMLSDELLSHAEIESEVDASLAETKRREIDDTIDVPISPFLDQNCRTRALFHIQNHPFRETTAFVANSVLERLGYPQRVKVDGHDYQKDTHIPTLPSIMRYFEPVVIRRTRQYYFREALP